MMTVSELIRKLQQFDGNKKACFYNCRYDEDLSADDVVERVKRTSNAVRDGETVVVVT